MVRSEHYATLPSRRMPLPHSPGLAPNVVRHPPPSRNELALVNLLLGFGKNLADFLVLSPRALLRKEGAVSRKNYASNQKVSKG